MADGRAVPRQYSTVRLRTAAGPYGFARSATNSEVRLAKFGVIQLTLEPALFHWEFHTTDGTIAHSGLDTCR